MSNELNQEAEKLATNLKETNENTKAILKSNAEISESLGKTAEALSAIVSLTEKSLTAKSNQENEAIASLVSEVALLKSKSMDKKSSSISQNDSELEKNTLETLKAFSNALTQKSSITIGTADFAEKSTFKPIYDNMGRMVQKSMQTFDNSDVGAFVPNTRILGELNINLQTVSPIVSLVSNINAGAIVAGDLGYKTFDESLVDMFESNESEGKPTTEQIRRGEIIIHVAEQSAKVKISDKTVHSIESGELIGNPLMKLFGALENRYRKNIGRQILNGSDSGLGIKGIFSIAHQSGSKMKVVETAADNVVTLKDLGNLTSQIKIDYLRNAVMLVDRKVLYEGYFNEAADGHLRLEQFEYSANGMIGLRTPEGVIPLVGVDSSYFEADVASNDGFANYKTFDGGSNIIKSGYTPSQYASVAGATDNAGKAVAILADWKMAYSLANSSVVRLGYDQSFGNMLLNGYVWGGKIGYVGGAPTVEETIAILTVK